MSQCALFGMLVNGSAMLFVGKENTPDRGPGSNSGLDNSRRVRYHYVTQSANQATTRPLVPKLTPVVFLHGFVDGTI